MVDRHLEKICSDPKIGRHHADQARALGNVPYVQLTWAGNIYKKSAPGFFRISAGRFL